MSGVYIIGHRHEDGRIYGPVKMGISRNANARLSELQTANPRELAHVFLWDAGDRATALTVEAGFHRANAKHRLKGEWFDLDPIASIFAMRDVLLDLLDFDIGLPPLEVMQELDADVFGPTSLRVPAP